MKTLSEYKVKFEQMDVCSLAALFLSTMKEDGTVHPQDKVLHAKIMEYVILNKNQQGFIKYVDSLRKMKETMWK